MKLNKHYIGCNFTGLAYVGGVDSSFNGSFKDEEVLIESGALDYVPCVIGDVSEAYEILKTKIKEQNATSFENICACIYNTVDEFFGGIKNISNRMQYYKSLDEITNEKDIGKVASLRGTGAAMCVERAMLSQNLLKSLGFNSFYKSSGIKNNGKKEIHSYNLVQNGNSYYIFDSSIPAIINNQINPLVAEIPKEVFDGISNKNQFVGYSVSVAHYNPIRDNNVEIVYDAGRKDIYQVENNQKRSK